MLVGAGEGDEEGKKEEKKGEKKEEKKGEKLKNYLRGERRGEKRNLVMDCSNDRLDSGGPGFVGTNVDVSPRSSCITRRTQHNNNKHKQKTRKQRRKRRNHFLLFLSLNRFLHSKKIRKVKKGKNMKA